MCVSKTLKNFKIELAELSKIQIIENRLLLVIAMTILGSFLQLAPHECAKEAEQSFNYCDERKVQNENS